MKIKEVSGSAGYHIEIEPAGGIYGADYVSLVTHNAAPYEDHDEQWVFKRKRFLKVVAKALGVVIYEPTGRACTAGRIEDVGYYQ